MKISSYLLLSILVLNYCAPGSVLADDDKWKVGRGKVFRQLFSGNEGNDQQANRNQARPTPPARQPSGNFRPQEPNRGPASPAQAKNDPRNRSNNPLNPANFDPRRNSNSGNQQPISAQQRAQWEAQQRAVQQQQGRSFQGGPQQPNFQANPYPWNAGGEYGWNDPGDGYNRGQGTGFDPRRSGTAGNPRLTSAGVNPNDNRQLQASGNYNPANKGRNDKRTGPKPVGFGLELKADREDQIFITRTDKNGNAENVGLRRGDQVLQIGGVDLTTVEEFIEIEKIMQDGDQIELKVQRGGKTAKVVLTFGEGIQESDYPAEGSYQTPRAPVQYNFSNSEPYEFVPRQNPQDQVRGSGAEPGLDPRMFDSRMFDSPRPPAKLPAPRPNLHELELELDSNFNLPPRSSQNSNYQRSILESK
jgi:hypothetical protein